MSEKAWLQTGIWIAFLCIAPPAIAAEKPWAFQAPTRPPVPNLTMTVASSNPIDRFIRARLHAVGLQPAAEADRATLLRRLSFDLIGLPPTPAEIEAFVGDSSPNAYEKQVDHLLASPRHGERWAMFWLDLVRFAESDGFKADDPRPTAWRYRDYVIQALNRDRPYDRFIREQLAGDELWPNDPDALVATGFCRHFPDEYNAVNLEQRRQEILNDITDTTAQVFLGLTLGCARCHDHKFDPIAQEDYYRIQAFFAGFWPADAPIGSPETVEAHHRQVKDWEARTAALRKQMQELEEPYRAQFLAKRKSRFPSEYQAMYDMPAGKRSPLQQQIAAMVAKQVEAPGDDISRMMKPDVRQKWQGLAKQMAEFRKAQPRMETALAMTDLGPTPPATHLLRRGEWRKPDQEIAPGFLSAIDNRLAPATPGKGRRTSGRRSMLADWLTQPQNPLTARVMVNRLWQHHFGRGLVATPSDFGAQGEPPTHRELLDWLACELVEHGWSLRHMHRLMVTSATYRQSTRWDEASARKDPDNRLLWRMNRRRLEGEALRDAMLAVSGQLTSKAGGPSVYPELPAEIGVPRGGWPVSPDVAERNRRSVYVFVKRNLRYPLFGVFDAPEASESCARRYQTTTAPQALMLLNGKFAVDQARSFAERINREAGPSRTHLVDRAIQLAFGRSPVVEERQLLMSFLNDHDLVDLCHAVLNVNEFLYVD